MKIVIRKDNDKYSSAQEVGWGYYLTRTKYHDVDKLCVVCGRPIGDGPGWKTIFHGTPYHERCLTVVDKCTEEEASRNCQKFFTAAMRIGGWPNWR